MINILVFVNIGIYATLLRKEVPSSIDLKGVE